MTQPNQTLMFAYDYYPGQSLQVITRLQQSVTNTVLGQEGDDGEIVSDPSEWNSYIANYQLDGDTPGEYILMFTRDGQLDDEFDLGTSATFFNDEYNLLEVSVDGNGDGNDDDDTPTPEEETPTPEEGTPTPEPIDETPTPEGGGGDGGNGGGGNGGDGGG